MNAPALTLEMLHERFRSGLDRRLSQLNACLLTLHSPMDPAAKWRSLEELTRGFHSLAGIGGTYGFSAISEAARRGELTCGSIELPLSAGHAGMLAEVIESLTTAVAEARRL
jgi:chemotaxis protein histidine kinase CheA